jgi:hypothetical protein
MDEPYKIPHHFIALHSVIGNLQPRPLGYTGGVAGHPYYRAIPIKYQ